MILKTVVIGCGWAGIKFINAILRNENATLAALVDIDEELVKGLATVYNVPYFTTITDLFESGIPFDTAGVCTLPDTHFELCKRLLQKGVNVFCEKPLCRSSHEAEQLYIIARNNNVKLSVGFNQRYGKAVQRAMECISNGETIHLITAAMYQHGYNYRQSSEYHILTDSCCHLFDTIYMICGRAKSVCMAAAKISSTVLTDVSVLLEFENGAIGTVSHTYEGGTIDTQHPFQRIEIHTDRARYVIENLYDYLKVYPHSKADVQVWQPSVFERRDYEDSMTSSVDHFIKSISIDKGDNGHTQDTVHILRIIEAAIRSAESRAFERVE